ncbi:MAG: YceD family protein [Candidatus Cryptobacteroides sp.]
MNADFIVPLNGLTQGRKEFRWRVGKEFFDGFENSEILDAGLDVTVLVEKSGHFIGVDSEVEGSVTVICDRCSEELQLPVETGFSLSVKFGPEASDEGLTDESEREIVCLPESDADLDLSQIIYDYVCLSLPVQRVHEEGSCNPEALKYLNSGETPGTEDNDSSLPFAALKSMLEKK